MTSFEDFRFTHVRAHPDEAPNKDNRAQHLHDGRYYVSINSRTPPSPPRRRRNMSLYYPHEYYNTPSWYDPTCPYAPFCLTLQPWHERIFACLQGNKKTFPLVTNVSDWIDSDGNSQQTKTVSLQQDLQHKWWQLEGTLIKFYETVVRLNDRFPHPMDIKYMRLPHRWGYLREHDDVYVAQTRLLHARNAFVLLLALCTYAVAVSEWTSLVDAGLPANLHWIRALVDKYHIDSVWVNDLASSHFMSKRSLRVGVYIDLAVMPPSNIIELYVTYGVPIWFLLPSNPTSSTVPFRLRFTTEDIASVRQANERLARQRQQQQQQQQQQLRQPTANLNHPPSRQLRGEKPVAFIIRNISANERAALSEDERHFIARVDRERSAYTFHCPGPNGAYVFEWVNTLRTYVPRAQVPLVWNQYAKTQKWFNSFRNEWDLCRELYPPATPEDDDDDDDSDEEERVVYDAGALSHASVNLETFSHALATEAYDQPPTVHSKIDTPVQDDLLFYRYGFHPDNHTYAAPPVVLSEEKVARALGEDTFAVYSFRRSAIDFVSFMVYERALPAALSDLNIGNGSPLRSHRSSVFRFRVINDHLFQVTTTTGGTSVLSFPYPSYVVETLCLSHCTNVYQLASYFLSKGSWFHTGDSSLDLDPFADLAGFNYGLGLRSKDFQPTILDFQSYITRRNELLKNPSVARAALLKGGIIWRLTVNAIRDIYGTFDVDQVLTDNSDEVTQLTKHDIGVIVGLYIKWTGESTVTREISWWPQFHHWRGSGLDVRYWGGFCEKWYQLRLQGIRDGSFQVRSASEWGVALKFDKGTGKLVKRNEFNSSQFLLSL